MREAEPAKSERVGGIADITHGLQVSLLNWPSELVSDDDCRRAVSYLNTFRSRRVENLRDGYNVSDILYYDID